MARNKGKLSREEKRWRHQRETQRQNDVVQHSAAILTCAAETAGDFAYLCTEALEELDLDLPYLRLALEIWREHPNQSTQALLAALEDLLTERLRHREALNRIEQQLQHLEADPSLHIHLDPIDRYRELVRLRLYPPPPPAK
jgi:hypothetical protein